MISYELYITRREHNLKFQEELEEFNAKMVEQERQRRENPYGNKEYNAISTPQVYLTSEILKVALSEEQFEIIKVNIIKEWK